MYGKFALSLSLILLMALSSIPIDTSAAAVVVHAKKKRRAAVITLPAKHRTVRYRGVSYYHVRGTYYRKGPSGYVVITPPVGLVITTLPIGYTTLTIGGGSYFYYQNIYYQTVPNGYVIVEEPAQTVVIHNTDKATIGNKVIVDIDSLNVRSGPGKDQSILRVLGRGTRMKILEVGTNWYYVELSDRKTGWVMIRHTKRDQPPTHG